MLRDIRARRISWVAGVALSAVIGVSLAEAQSPPATPPNRLADNSPLERMDRTTGKLVIEVLDGFGERMIRGDLRLFKDGTNNELNGTIDTPGRVEFPNLPAGDYILEASDPGFKTFLTTVNFPEQHLVRVSLPKGILIDYPPVDYPPFGEGAIPLLEPPGQSSLQNSLLPLTPEPPQAAPPPPPLKRHNAFIRLLLKIPH